MLLVDHDQAEPGSRGEHRGAGADDDPRLPARDPLALVAPLGLGQAGVEDRDRVPEAGAHPPERLGCERDLGDEQDRPLATIERRLGDLEVDLGLARAGRTVEQERAPLAGRERGDDPLGRGALLGTKRRRLLLARERLALRRGAAQAAPAREASARPARARGPASSRSSRRARARARRARARPGRRRPPPRPPRLPRADAPRARRRRRAPCCRPNWTVTIAPIPTSSPTS